MLEASSDEIAPDEVAMLQDYLNRRDEEQRMKQSGRLPPGQSLTQKFPVLHYGPVPEIDLSTWTLSVFGDVERPVQWTWDEFKALPTATVRTDIHCVTGWSKFDTVWEGTLFRDFVKLCVLKPDVTHVVAHAAHGFSTNLPLEIMLEDDVLLAWKFDGKPLTPDHGFPVRTLVPQRYFWKSAKWLLKLEFANADRPGFWERAGYHNEGDPWKEERYQRR